MKTGRGLKGEKKGRRAKTKTFEMSNEAGDAKDEFVDFGAEIPNELKGLRACLRCSLLKTFTQFDESGCENCDFLGMKENSDRVHDCTTAYFEGSVAVMEAQNSWVAKWQRINTFVPGMYALDVSGRLPEDMIELCESYGYEIRSQREK